MNNLKCFLVMIGPSIIAVGLYLLVMLIALETIGSTETTITQKKYAVVALIFWGGLAIYTTVYCVDVAVNYTHIFD